MIYLNIIMYKIVSFNINMEVINTITIRIINNRCYKKY